MSTTRQGGTSEPLLDTGPVDQTLRSVAHGYSVAVSRDFRRNARLFAGWEGILGLGLPFIIYSVMVPAYLGHLGASRTMISLVLAFPWVCVPAQICSGVWLRGIHRRRFLVLGQMAATLPWLAYSMVLLLAPGAMGPAMRKMWFIAAMAWFNTCVATSIPLYFDMLTDNTPLPRRGRLAGFRGAAVGLAGLLSAGMAAWVMNRWNEPTNFLISFLIGTSIFAFSSLTLLRIRDHMDPTHVQHQAISRNVTRQLRRVLRRLWRNANCRVFLFFHALLVVAFVQAPLIVDAAGRQLGATPPQQQRFAIVFLASLIGPIWFLGRLADRFGYRLLSVMSSCFMATCYVLVLCFPSLHIWYVAYCFFAIAVNLSPTVLGNMCVELIPRIEPGLLVSTARLILLPLVIGATLLAGRLGDAKDSYLFMFTLGATVSAIATLGFALLAREPRTGRLYVVKTIPQPQ